MYMALSQKQYITIETLLAHPTWSNEQIAKEAGVNRNSVSNWKRLNEEFKEEYKRRLKENWEGLESIAIDTMKNLTLNGDFKASKYILDSLGYAPAQRIEADISNDIVISIGE